MSPLAAMLLAFSLQGAPPATPAYGLRLSAPLVAPASFFVGALDAPVELQVQAATGDAQAEADRRYAAAVRLRADLGTIHRALGITTWVVMAVALAAGMIQYYNLYGFGAGRDTNPCATGQAVFGQDQCWGTPWLHAISAGVTTALYGVTMSMSFGLLANDPNDVLGGRGSYSDRIRAHSVLALIHLAGMVAQIVMGVGVANGWFGDRTNDYGTLQAVATAHQVIGFVTWGALGAAAALMLF